MADGRKTQSKTYLPLICSVIDTNGLGRKRKWYRGW